MDFFLNVCWRRPYAKIEQEFVVKSEVKGSLGDTPDTYRDNLVIIDKFISRNTEFEAEYGDIVLKQKLYIVKRWVEYLIYHGHGSQARSVLREHQSLIPDDHLRLRVKSYFSYLTAKILGRYRDTASRDR